MYFFCLFQKGDLYLRKGLAKIIFCSKLSSNRIFWEIFVNISYNFYLPKSPLQPFCHEGNTFSLVSPSPLNLFSFQYFPCNIYPLQIFPSHFYLQYFPCYNSPWFSFLAIFFPLHLLLGLTSGTLQYFSLTYVLQ